MQRPRTARKSRLPADEFANSAGSKRKTARFAAANRAVPLEVLLVRNKNFELQQSDLQD
ncbi:MAG: hypothetical protein KDA87_14165 [Planctomycetales bacterium]|nr:hypothetical protein [Planctomycetales bacterium]